MNKTGVIIGLMIIGGIVGGIIVASSFFLVAPTSKYTPIKVEKVIMIIQDEGPNPDQSFQTLCKEKSLNAVYLERTVNWIEVEKVGQTFGFIQSGELTIVNVTFTDTKGDGSGDDLIDVSVFNSGTKTEIISQVNFNDVTQTGNWKLASGEDSITPGNSDNVQITVDWTKGNKYSVTFFAIDGSMVSTSFTITA